MGTQQYPETLKRDDVGFMDRLARRVVLRALERFPRGRLTIIEPDGHPLTLGQGEPVASLTMSDWRTWRLMLTGGSIGAAEAFMEGFWESANLTDVIRYFAANVDEMDGMESGFASITKPLRHLAHVLNRNTLSGSRRNIAAHYDLGNDFFALFLDRRMMYSSAVYPTEDASLEEASAYKLDLICRKLQLNADTHLLEIGTGWGGLAIHAASHYGCRVTTATISHEQYEYARCRVREAGLEDRVEVLERDYRLLEGRYDRIVSVEMIEAVGAEFLDTYFRKLGSLLTDDGLLLLQAITIPHQRYEYARDNVDFIKRYIFPGGFLPSVQVMLEHMGRHTRLVPVHLEDIGLDYARTLGQWSERFRAASERVREQGFDRRFRRMWQYYLAYCEGAFLERAIGTVQLLAAGPAASPARIV